MHRDDASDLDSLFGFCVLLGIVGYGGIIVYAIISVAIASSSPQSPVPAPVETSLETDQRP